jgi:hypothetical protein
MKYIACPMANESILLSKATLFTNEGNIEATRKSKIALTCLIAYFV